jgi:uncharacterized membrane protein YkvA (DUF1232 family)
MDFTGDNEMTDKKKILKNADRGFFQDLILRGKLILRLMGDKRVNFLLKILPVGGLIYLLSPIDLIPDIALPVIGYLDDAVVIWLCMTLFVALCPDEVVQEHMNALNKVMNATWRDAPEQNKTDEVIDAEFHDVSKGGQ